MTYQSEDYAAGLKDGEEQYRIYLKSVLNYLKDSLSTSDSPEPTVPISSLIKMVEEPTNHP